MTACFHLCKCLQTALGLETEGFIVVSDRKLISVLSMSVEALEMSCAEAADALAPQERDLKPKITTEPECCASDVRLQEVKYILNPVLQFRYFFCSLSILGLSELAVMSHLRFNQVMHT